MTTPTPTSPVVMGGEAFKQMLSHVNVDQQFNDLKKEIVQTKSPSKRDVMVKKLKYLAGIQKMDVKPEEAFILHHIPVTPPLVRPSMQMGGNRIEYADVNNLYKDHMLVNTALKENIDFMPDKHLIEARRDLYDGAKAVFGLGDAITGNSRGKQLKGYIKQISGDLGPKGGFFHSKLLSKKQDFSGRATIAANADLGFNEMGVPIDMIWTMYEFHIIRDMVKSGYSYVDAKKAVTERNVAATSVMRKLIKTIPMIINRAPTLMRTNITAHYPVPVAGKTLQVNPLHLNLYSGDFDGDAVSSQLPMTPEAIEEARNKLLPEHHIYDYRKGQGASMVAPGHESIIGSMHITEPDVQQKPVTFKTEAAALAALKEGKIKENTPIIIEASS